MEDNGLELVFVYGTLKIGERNHHFLSEFECIDKKSRTKSDTFVMQETASFSSRGNTSPIVMPAKSSSENTGAILGQVFAVNHQGLAALDELEEYYPDNEESSHYLRKRILTADNREVWMYFLNGENHKGIINPPKHVHFNAYKNEYNWA